MFILTMRHSGGQKWIINARHCYHKKDKSEQHVKEKVGEDEEPGVLAGGCAPPHLQGLCVQQEPVNVEQKEKKPDGINHCCRSGTTQSHWQMCVLLCVCEYCITTDSCSCIHMCTRQMNQQRHVSGRLNM